MLLIYMKFFTYDTSFILIRYKIPSFKFNLIILALKYPDIINQCSIINVLICKTKKNNIEIIKIEIPKIKNKLLVLSFNELVSILQVLIDNTLILAILLLKLFNSNFRYRYFVF